MWLELKIIIQIILGGRIYIDSKSDDQDGNGDDDDNESLVAVRWDEFEK